MSGTAQQKALASMCAGADNGGAASYEAVEIGVSNHKAGTPLQSGIFMPVRTTVAPSMVGRGGGYFGSVGFFVADTPTSLRSCLLRLASKGGDLSSHKGAFIMPKLVRTFFTYSLIAIITLAIERNTPIPVIVLSLAALVLVQVIGGRYREHA